MRIVYVQILLVYALSIITACSRIDDYNSATAISGLSSTTVVSPTDGYTDTAVVTVDRAGNVSFVGGNWSVPLPVSAGDQIGTLSAIVSDNGPSNGHALDGNIVFATLRSRPAGCTSTSCEVVLSTAQSNGSGTPQQTLTMGTSHTVTTGEEMLVTYVALRTGAVPGPATVPSMIGAVTITPAASPTLRTVPISVQTPSHPDYRQPIAAGETFSAFIPSSPGTTIIAVRLSIQDVSSGTYSLQLRDAEWGDFLAFDASSAPSSGSNRQTLSLAANVPVVSGRAYEINLDSYSTGSLFVYGAEFDVR